MEAPRYLHLVPGSTPPDLGKVEPFRAVVIAESEVDREWQTQVSDWLVRSGCRYMIAWGVNCDDWHVSVDLANVAMFDPGPIPDDGFVMTTSHGEYASGEGRLGEIGCVGRTGTDLRIKP